MIEFETNLVTVGTLLKDGTERSYVVPRFQRKYVWSNENVSQLLKDIHYSYEKEPKSIYFLGGMVFSKDEDDDNLLVIDGQQRLTTLVLLSLAARDYFDTTKNVESKDLHSQKIFISGQDPQTGEPIKKCVLNLQTQDEQLFKTLKDGTENGSDNSPKSTLIEAKQECDEFLLQKVINVNLFMKYLYNNVQVIKTVAENQSTAFQIFETLNYRGIKLGPEDLLKNLMLSKINDDMYDRFDHQWTQIIENLNVKESGEVSASTFLRHYLMSTGVYISKDDLFKHFKDTFENIKSQQKVQQKVLETLEELNETSKLYKDYSNGKGNSHIAAMHKLKFKQGIVVLLGCKSFHKDDLKKVSKLLEQIAFAYVITNSQTNALERKFVKIAELASKSTKDPSKKDEMYDELKKIALEKRQEVRNALMTFRYKPNLNAKNKIHYLLNKLSLNLDGSEYPEFEIEHILPKKQGSEWKHITGDYDDLKIRLGNLTLINPSDNSSLQNKSFSEKINVYINQPCRLTSSLAVPISTGTSSTVHDKAIKIYDYKPPKEWNEKEIDRRTKQLIELTDYVFFGN